MSFGTDSIPPRRTRVAKGNAAQLVTNPTDQRAKWGEASQSTGFIPKFPSSPLTGPSLASRNFHTLPLTSGGRAQTKVMSDITADVVRERSTSTAATANPTTRSDTSSMTVSSRVTRAAAHSTWLWSWADRLAKPTHDQDPMRLVGPTLLKAICTSLISG